MRGAPTQRRCPAAVAPSRRLAGTRRALEGAGQSTGPVCVIREAWRAPIIEYTAAMPENAISVTAKSLKPSVDVANATTEEAREAKAPQSDSMKELRRVGFRISKATSRIQAPAHGPRTKNAGEATAAAKTAVRVANPASKPQMRAVRAATVRGLIEPIRIRGSGTPSDCSSPRDRQPGIAACPQG